MLFLLDMSNLIHAYYHVKASTLAGDELVDDATKSILIRMDKLCDYFTRLFPKSVFVGVFDNPSRRLFRSILWPDYKSGRTKGEEIPLIESALIEAVDNSSDWTAVVADVMFEADDVIASLAKNHDGKVLIHSTDRDCHSMLEDGRVTIVKKSNTPVPMGEMEIEYYTAKDLFAEYGLSPIQWIDFQVLIGGKDAVPGWDGVGPKAAKKIIDCGDDIGELNVDFEPLNLNKKQKQSYESFCRLLPTIRLVRSPVTNLVGG